MSDENTKAQSKARIHAKSKSTATPHLVGDCEDILPYAWGTPMIVNEHRCSKVLREMKKEEEKRLCPQKPND